MYEIVYLSDADRARLVELNEAVRSCTTVEEQRAVRDEIAEVESRRKPLHECNVEECTELRTHIWGKFDKLNRAGKYSLAQQFKLMLVQIEMRQAALHREAALAEAQRAKTATSEKTKRKKKAKDENTGTGKVTAKPNASRWTAGIGNLD